ncbi:hypothetical protein ACHAPT_000818 [Fusarium lateritium]
MKSHQTNSALDDSSQYEAEGHQDAGDIDTDSIREKPRRGRQSQVHDHLLPSGSSPPSSPRRQSWSKRIGLVGIATLVLGTIVILASIAILIFLWRGAQLAEHREEPVLWQTIVFRGWAPQVVTICSAAIRIAMAFQGGFVVAAVAAIMLETSGVSLVDTAILSVERALGSTPFNLLLPALRRCAAATRSGRLPAIMHFVMVTATLVISLLSTLTSTILLSDFNPSQIASPPITANVGIDLSTDKALNWLFAASLVKSRPMANWRFAEARGSAPSAKGDTGDVYRGILPFQDADSRRLLEFFSGPAVVTNLRVVCVAPEFRNLTLASVKESNIQGGGVTLNVMADDVPPSLDWKLSGDASSSTAAPVNARLVDAWPTSSPPSWPLSLYFSHQDSFKFEEPLEPLSRRPYLFYRVLLFNSTVLLNETRMDGGDDLPASLRNLTTKKENLWTRALNSDGKHVFSATECYFNNALPHLYNVTMSGRGIPSEPTGDWRRGPGHENHTKILHQLGVGAASFKDRGILNLTVGSRLPGADGLIENSFLTYALMTSGTPPNDPSTWSWSWGFTDSWKAINSDVLWLPHPAHSSLFQSIMLQTEDPAQAIQAFMTRLFQMQYYDILPDLDRERPSEMIYSTERLTPSRWVGLVIVLCLVGAHLVLVLTTAVLFILRTRDSALGNIWQAVSQMVSPETRQVFESTGFKKADDDMRACVETMGQDPGVYGMSRSVETGRVEIRLRERRKEILNL